MKITTEIQFIQNRCIEKAHPWLSFEEAIGEEMLYWCIYKNMRTWLLETETGDDLFTIFWLPPCLARVLNGLGVDYKTEWLWDHGESRDFFIKWKTRNLYIKWKLLNPDWSPATLFDQSTETISAIAKEMWYI